MPAGSLDKMRAAYDFGADAVYAGQPRYSLRARNNEFKMRDALGQSVQVAQGNPVRVWIPLAGRYSGALLARVVEGQVAAAQKTGSY